MPNIGDVLNAFALKAGIAADNEHLKNILSAPDLAKISVPDELVSLMDAGLVSIEAAKNNHPAIKGKYFADAYDGIDAEIHKQEVDAEVLEAVKAEKNTAKKIQLLVNKLKATKPADTGEANTLKGKINELQTQLAGLAEEKAKLIKDHTDSIRNMQRDIRLESEWGSYKTIYDKLDPGVKKLSFKALIDKSLQDSNAVLTIDDNGNLTLIGKDGSNVFGSDHRQLTPKAFLDKVFAPILEVSTPAQPGIPKPPAPGTPPASAGTSFVSSHNAQALADFENASKAKMF